MPDEKWTAVAGFEGIYEVSDMGRVRSLTRQFTDAIGRPVRKNGRVLKLTQRKAKYCYPTVTLCNTTKGVMRVERVHILVMENFVGARPPGMYIRHLNGDYSDPRLSNLAYGTASENALDTVDHGNHPWTNKTHCPKDHPLSGDNLCINSKGARTCRICRRDSWRRYRARKKLALAALPTDGRYRA